MAYNMDPAEAALVEELSKALVTELQVPMWRALTKEQQRVARTEGRYEDHCYVSVTTFNDLPLLNVVDGHRKRHYTLNLITGRPTKACEDQRKVSADTVALAKQLHELRVVHYRLSSWPSHFTYPMFDVTP